MCKNQTKLSTQIEEISRAFPKLKSEEASQIFSPSICPNMDMFLEEINKNVLEEIINVRLKQFF